MNEIEPTSSETKSRIIAIAKDAPAPPPTPCRRRPKRNKSILVAIVHMKLPRKHKSRPTINGALRPIPSDKGP